MKICFIGGNGFLANSFAEKYNYAQLDVYGRYKPKYFFTSFEELDILRDRIDFSKFMKYDEIFYFSALGVQSSISYSFHDLLKVNFTFPVELISFLSENSFKGKFLSFGSYFEVGIYNEKKSLTENNIIYSEYKTVNYYSLTKRLLTRFLDSSILNLKYNHFIIPTVYGKGENKNRLIPYVINSIRSGKEINLSDGYQIRHYLHINELVKSIHLASSNNLESGIYNIGGGEILSVREIVNLITQNFDKKSLIINYGKQSKVDTQMPFLALNSNKIDSKIPIGKILSLKDNIKEYLELENERI